MSLIECNPLTRTVMETGLWEDSSRLKLNKRKCVRSWGGGGQNIMLKTEVIMDLIRSPIC